MARGGGLPLNDILGCDQTGSGSVASFSLTLANSLKPDVTPPNVSG